MFVLNQPAIRIILKNQSIVAVSKPPHMPIHPSPCCPQTPKNNNNNMRLYLIDEVSKMLGSRVYTVHRLDAQTSGVTIFALSSESARMMQSVLKDKVNTIKEYITFVRGTTPDKWINNKPLKKLKFDDDEKGDPQEAETHFETIAHFSYCSLIKARILTGRTHQIRRHLSSEAHQIIGDRQYGKGRINNMARDLYGLQRLFLHSYRLEFLDPTTNERITLRDPLSEDLVAFLRKLPDFKEDYIKELL